MDPTSAASSLDLTRLRAAYHAGHATAEAVMAALLARMTDAAVWISHVSDDELLAQARTADLSLPLGGVPFAVKDNIDVAGLPTTAGCPAFAYTPAVHAPVVQRLVDAGAIVVGKTNLDQFATGLVGVRSPYGVPLNPFDPAMIPGGSSSGSAVAVAAGLVSFALGTDTAGSGRVPAGLNNLVGLKPTRGWLSTTGVVPACRSLDCVSILALTVPDALAVLDVARGYDPADPYSRVAGPEPATPSRFRFGVPAPLEFFGDASAAHWFAAAVARAEALGGTAVPFDYAPFAEAAGLLYGPWAAEQAAAVGGHMLAQPDALHPVLQGILQGGAAVPAPELFRAQHRLAALRRQTEAVWQTADLLLPTAGTAYSLAQVAAEPVAANARLGHYTNFVNLLDLAALAVPAGFHDSGFPHGVTLVGPAWSDRMLAHIGARLHRAAATPLGATGAPQPHDGVEIAVFGAHMTGQPLNPDVVARGGWFVRACQTAPAYRMLALSGRLRRPALVRSADGASLEGEVWALPPHAVATFLGSIAPPLGLGTVELEHGPSLGFIAEAGAECEDITAFGGWRGWLRDGDSSPACRDR
jgi:allophanate hydrolase